MLLVLNHYTLVSFQRAVETFLKMVVKQGGNELTSRQLWGREASSPLCSKIKTTGILGFILHNDEN